MKYVWHWEWSMEDFDREQELSDKFAKALQEDPSKFPKMLTNTLYTCRGKGFRLIDADNEEQLANLVAFWWPTEDWWLEAVIDGQGGAMQKAVTRFPLK
jgi:hypothetical protein